MFTMKWSEFWQIFLLSPLLLGCLIFSIIILKREGLDTYFLTTLIIAILTIVLSIYYSGKTNQVFNEITSKISGLEKGNESLMGLLNIKLNKYEEFNITEEKQKSIDKLIKENIVKKK